MKTLIFTCCLLITPVATAQQIGPGYFCPGGRCVIVPVVPVQVQPMQQTGWQYQEQRVGLFGWTRAWRLVPVFAPVQPQQQQPQQVPSQ